MVWVKGQKGIKGNEEADKLCRETSILGHESQGVVTPAGLRAWGKRVRAEARGGSGEGILGWHRKAISAYTWCSTEKGPQRKWLYKIKKKDTPECHCQEDAQDTQPEQSGEHLVERCRLLEEKRKLVEKGEMREWRTRHSRNANKKEEKGPVEPEKEKEKETDKLELFFCHLYEFHNPITVAPAFVPAGLPPRYAIDFVPVAPSPFPLAASAVHFSVSPAAALAPSTSATSNFSVVSSVNFVPASVFTSSSSCIGTTQ